MKTSLKQALGLNLAETRPSLVEMYLNEDSLLRGIEADVRRPVDMSTTTPRYSS
jgi:hypothetical protein